MTTQSKPKPKTRPRAAPKPRPAPGTSNAVHDLLEIAAAKGTFHTFARVVEAAGLRDTLAGPGPFTVFAPTDEAFGAMPAGELDRLLLPQNQPELLAALKYHVMTGRKTARDVGRWDSALTLNGLAACMKLVGRQVSIDGAQVTLPDLDARNGYLHGIDQVLTPARGKRQ